jgi:putative spermidine/putrescine transport system ATP-binding protein
MIETIGITKSYGGNVALSPTNLTIKSGEFFTLLGPSGSGKTTLLQIISGLVAPSSGRLKINGVDVTDVEPGKRGIGMVFQSYALFPHMTVWENVAYAMRMRKHSKDVIAQSVDHALTMVRMSGFSKRYPKELSGGQQQRIALARCFAYKPSVILLDEPLGALDKKLREHMQSEIRQLHQELGATFIYVTHDQDEALTLSDRVCLLNNTQIEQIGSPADLYDRPSSRFTAEFIGHSNFLEGTTSDLGSYRNGDNFATAIGNIPVPPGATAVNGETYSLLIRPEVPRLVEPHVGFVSGVISELVFFGSDIRLQMTMTDGSSFSVRCGRELTPKVGDTVGLVWDPKRTSLLRAQN